MSITEITTIKDELYRKVDELALKLVDIAEQIHDRPETSFQEFFATELLATAAKDAGFTVVRNLGNVQTAFKAEYRGADLRPVVAFLAEYDALPGLGHACGHNLIATASLGAALALASLDTARSLPGTIQLIGTPAEEEGGGKVLLADAGVFKDVDAALMFHPANKNQLWKHAMASRILEFEFFGKAAHSASSPEEGVNALDATIQTFNNINALRQHLKPDARVHGIIENGGYAPNIVPDYSSSVFFVRSLDDNYCAEIVEKVKNCAAGAATATGARLNIKENGGYKTLKTNMPLTESFHQNMIALGVIFEKNEPWDDLGSTDLGDVSHIVPCIHPYMSIGPATMGYHTPDFAKAARSEDGYRTMLLTTKAMGATALDYFLDPDFQQRVRDDFLTAR